MREKYFTAKSIKAVSRSLLDEVDFISSGKNILFTPRQSVLLILDMQNYFLNKNSHAFIPSAKAIIPNIIKLRDFYIKSGLKVIYTRHVNNDSDAQMMGKWWTQIIKCDDPLSGLSSEIKTQGCNILEKTQYDAFYNTTLENDLKKDSIKQVVISGVMTHLCCETTARSAFVRGFEVFFIVDATATYNLKYHKASILNLSHGFAKIVSTDDLIVSLNRIYETK